MNIQDIQYKSFEYIAKTIFRHLKVEFPDRDGGNID